MNIFERGATYNLHFNRQVKMCQDPMTRNTIYKEPVTFLSNLLKYAEMALKRVIK